MEMKEDKQLEDFAWFDKNRESIIKDHLGQSVVIKDKAIVGYYPNDRKALEAMKDCQPGSFIVQRCLSRSNTDMFYYTGRYAIV